MKTAISNFFVALLVLSGSVIRAQQFTNYTSASGLPADNVNGVAIDSGNHKWFGTQAGVAMFNDTTWKVYTTADGLIDNYITCIAVDRNDNVWAGTEMGVNKFNGTQWTTYTTSAGLINNSVTYIAADPDGSVWIGTNGGLSHLSGDTWTNYTTAQGLCGDVISYIAADSKGNKWIGTWLGGLSKFNGTTFTNFTTADSLPDNSVLSIGIGANNTKWIGSLNGVAVFDSLDKWMLTYRASDGLLNNFVQDIAMDSKGSMWFGLYDTYTQDGGISRFNTAGWKSLTTSDGLVDALVRRIAVDKKDNIWIATGNGVSKLTEWNIGINTLAATSVKIYPNPATSGIHIDGISEASHLQIFDITGNEIQAASLAAGSNLIRLQNIRAGVFFLRISSDAGTISRKLIVK
jgi:ligand-binding sensor domain-containing protein